MRRKRPAPAVPEPLARFVAAEWPGAGCVHEALRMWREACLEWLSGAPGRALPFGEFGGPLDVLRESRRYRRGVPPCPHEERPGTRR